MCNRILKKTYLFHSILFQVQRACLFPITCKIELHKWHTFYQIELLKKKLLIININSNLIFYFVKLIFYALPFGVLINVRKRHCSIVLHAVYCFLKILLTRFKKKF